MKVFKIKGIKDLTNQMFGISDVVQMKFGFGWERVTCKDPSIGETIPVEFCSRNWDTNKLSTKILQVTRIA